MPILQYILFEKALIESGIKLVDTRIDVATAKCYNDGIEYNVIFPKEYLHKINNIKCSKTFDYNFRGRYMKVREWILPYSNFEHNCVLFTQQGQDIEKESAYFFDQDYYQIIASSKFTLCPAGDYLWSYRFFEACLCKSIPIIESNEKMDNTMLGYKFYHNNDNHIYREDWVNHNYELVKKQHMLL